MEPLAPKVIEPLSRSFEESDCRPVSLCVEFKPADAFMGFPSPPLTLDTGDFEGAFWLLFCALVLLLIDMLSWTWWTELSAAAPYFAA